MSSSQKALFVSHKIQNEHMSEILCNLLQNEDTVLQFVQKRIQRAETY